jgi:hypothetical protein
VACYSYDGCVTPTPTVTTTNTATPTITPTNTLTPTETPVPIYTECVDCGLNMGVTGLTSSIAASTLTSRSGCTVGDYVVDWYLGSRTGTPQFTSGNRAGADVSVTVTHPFNSEPAQGGTWYPVIRFVYLNGVKYTAAVDYSASYSPDLMTCISSFSVTSLNCSTGNQTAQYPNSIVYSNATNSSTLAARSIRFDIDADHRYLAWNFQGNVVSDTIKISYVSPTSGTTTELAYWRVGQDIGFSSMTGSPQTYSAAAIKRITGFNDIPYSSGDYLRMDITPNSGNTNTDWSLSTKCLTSPQCEAIYSGATVRMVDTSSYTMSYNQSACAYELKYNRLYPTTATTTNNNFFLYDNYVAFGTNGLLNGEPNNTQVTLQLFSGKTTTTNTVSSFVTAFCTQQISGSTVSKSGNTITIVYDDIGDYNVMKNQFATASGRTQFFVTYSTDETSIQHYVYYDLGVIQADSCGDAATFTRSYSTHISSPPSFDDGTKTMTYVMVAPNNGMTAYSGLSCNDTYSAVQSNINTINTSINESNYSFRTKVRRGQDTLTWASIGGHWLGQSTTTETTKNFTYEPSIQPMSQVCDPVALGGWRLVDLGGVTGTRHSVYTVAERVVITNSADPINNFQVYRIVDAAGNLISNSANYILLYEISGGTVIYP